MEREMEREPVEVVETDDHKKEFLDAIESVKRGARNRWLKLEKRGLITLDPGLCLTYPVKPEYYVENAIHRLAEICRLLTDPELAEETEGDHSFELFRQMHYLHCLHGRLTGRTPKRSWKIGKKKTRFMRKWNWDLKLRLTYDGHVNLEDGYVSPSYLMPPRSQVKVMRILAELNGYEVRKKD